MKTEETAQERAQVEMESAMNEHVRCMTTVKALESLLDQRPESAEKWVAAVLDCLTRLRADLAEHFAEEPETWLYHEVPLRRPRFAATLKRLVEEHPELLRSADTVLQFAQSQSKSKRESERHDLRELNGMAQLLVAKLYRHEAEEREILVAAAFEETGVGG